MKQIIDMIILIGIFGLFFIGPIALTILNIISFQKKYKAAALIEWFTFFFGTILTTALYFCNGLTDWSEPLVLQGNIFGNYHEILSGKYILTFLALVAVSYAAYLLLRLRKLRMPPIVIVFCLSGLYVGIGLAVLWIVQISKNIGESTWFVCYMALFPINVIMFYVHEIIVILKEAREKYCPSEEEGKTGLQKILYHSKNWGVIALIGTLPLLGIIMIVLTLFGQTPDAWTKVFTETSDWALSTKVSPQPIEMDGHYLCTVAAAGDEKLVKPKRMGIRNGHKIIVNRQLMVANAFEDLLNEKSPKLHHAVRFIYDKYGYPLAKHIKTTRTANITYIIMKPLEWTFVFLLYLFDVEPENRIAVQYSPLKRDEK